MRFMLTRGEICPGLPTAFRRRTLLQRVSKSCCAEGTNSDRNARIQRRESQIISLAVTLLWVIRNTGRGMNRNSPATARDSGGSGSPRISVNPIQPSTENKSLGSRNEIDFGAESSPPTFSLSTLLFRRSPAGRQDSLPACLAASAGLDFHQLDSVEGFHPLIGIPLSQALLARYSSRVVRLPVNPMERLSGDQNG